MMPNLKAHFSFSMLPHSAEPRTGRAPSQAEVEARLQGHRGLLSRLSPEALARIRREAQDAPEISGEPTHTL